MNSFNLEEIVVFFRYRTFPLLLSTVVLSVFIHVFWNYLKTKKRELLFLSLAVFFLFLKEVMLFFATRHVLFDFELKRIEYDFFHWMSLELVFNFFSCASLIAVFQFFSLDANFHFPQPHAGKKKFLRFLTFHAILITALLVWLGNLYVNGQDFSIFLPLLMVYYFVALQVQINWCKQNYGHFDLHFLQRESLKKLNSFAFASLTLFLLFAFSTFLFTPFSNVKKVNANIFFEHSETYLHGFKFVIHVFLLRYVFYFLRGSNLAESVTQKKKRQYQNELRAFSRKLRKSFADIVDLEKIILGIVDEVQEKVKAENVLFLLEKRGRIICDFSSSEVIWERQEVEFSSLPYVKQLQELGLDVLVDDLEHLGKSVQEDFFFLPRRKDFSFEEFSKKREMVFENQKSEENQKTDTPTSNTSTSDASQSSELPLDDDHSLNADLSPLSESQHLENEEEESQLPEEHHVANIMAKSIQNDEEKVRFLLLVVNKRKRIDEDVDDAEAKVSWNIEDDPEAVWTKNQDFAMLETIAEEVMQYSDQMVYYDRYKRRHLEEVDRGVHATIDNLVRKMDIHFIEQQELDKLPLDISHSRLYQKGQLRSFFQCVAKRQKEVFLLFFDIVGNPNWVLFFQSLVQSTFVRSCESKRSLVAILEDLNKVVSSHQQDSFVNALILSFHLDTNEVSFVNASHQPPLFFLGEQKEILSHDVEGYPLGVKEKEQYKEKKVQLQKDDVVVVCSDNLTDLRIDQKISNPAISNPAFDSSDDPNANRYQFSRFVDIIARHSKNDAQNIIAALTQDVLNFAKDPNDENQDGPAYEDEHSLEDHLIVTIKI